VWGGVSLTSKSPGQRMTHSRQGTVTSLQVRTTVSLHTSLPQMSLWTRTGPGHPNRHTREPQQTRIPTGQAVGWRKTGSPGAEQGVKGGPFLKGAEAPRGLKAGCGSPDCWSRGRRRCRGHRGPGSLLLPAWHPEQRLRLKVTRCHSCRVKEEPEGAKPLPRPRALGPPLVPDWPAQVTWLPPQGKLGKEIPVQPSGCARSCCW
jgi:hypothetical protein